MTETFRTLEEYRKRYFPEECERERWEKLTVEERVHEWAEKHAARIFGKECDEPADG